MNTWIPFTGQYEKKFYDLKLKIGITVLHCWPIQGMFNPVNGTGGHYIDGSRVEQIRISETQWHFERESAPLAPAE